MTAPIYVGTRWDLDRFDPGPGLPVLTRSPSLVTVQDTLDAILVAAGKANIELRFSATGDPGNAPTDPYVTESELHAQLGTKAALDSPALTGAPTVNGVAIDAAMDAGEVA